MRDRKTGGRRKGIPNKVTADRIAEVWEELLAGPVREGYADWRRQGWARRIFRFGMRAVRARVIGRSYDR